MASINIDSSERQWLPKGDCEGGGHLKVITFSAASADHAFLSNMHPSKFTVDGVEYHSVEQSFQFQKMTKASFHNQARKIMAVPPDKIKSCKALGGKRFCVMSEEQQTAWHSQSTDVMLRALRAKFEQNPLLRRRLLETCADGKTVLVEKLPRFGDKLWGVGSKGVGQNRLGQLLMLLRDGFAAEEEKTTAP